MIVKSCLKRFGVRSTNLFLLFCFFFITCTEHNSQYAIKYDFALYKRNQKEIEYSIIQNRMGDTLYRKVYDSIYTMANLLYQKPSDNEYVILTGDSLYLFDSTLTINIKNNLCRYSDITNSRLETIICFRKYDYYQNILCKVYYVDYGVTRSTDQYNELIYFDTANLLIMQRFEEKNGELSKIECVTNVEALHK